MLFLLASALVGDLILLPAILAGPAGRIFSPSANRRRRQGKGDDNSALNEPGTSEAVLFDISKTTTAERDDQTGAGDESSVGVHSPPHTSTPSDSPKHRTVCRDTPHR